jgi:hypothetical protein
MSRSRKKTPISPIACASSEKDDKARANRRFRRVTRERLRSASEPPHNIREVSNVWLFAKDGRIYVDNPEFLAETMRK